jgi:AAA+ superfamily predicted ATPase
MRKKLWEKMLLPTLPLAPDLAIEQLATIDNVCGRDIKNAVVKAAIKTAINGETLITQKNLEDSIHDIIEANKEVTQQSSGSLSPDKKETIEKTIKRKLRQGKVRHVKMQ